ncbi:MAG: DUF5009 domain-containing protein [Gammaproteobacteria bacterium]|nr:DUF5009 domain-containing protein [Gammaproteobacteria bacterium]
MSALWYRYTSAILGGLPKERLLALDVFRGLTITAMVLVNNPGSWSYVYPPLLHAKWHGLTPTDLIFPFFVFIVGVSVAIVAHRNLKQGNNKLSVMKTASIRALKLFCLGLFLALFYYQVLNPNYSWLEERLLSIRVMGVLQRLALVFFFTMLIVMYLKRVWQCAIAVTLLLGYWLLMAFLPYQDPQGNVYQGLYEYGNNLTAWFDSFLFADKNLYYANAQPFAFDPEGVLSTLPSIAGCLIGVFTGNLLIDKTYSLTKKCTVMFLSGFGLLVLGYFWSLYFPVNKALWTSSFVLVTSGWALLILAALTFLIDMKHYKSWSAPFVVFGANAIFFYMFSAVVERILLMIPAGDEVLRSWLYVKIFQPLFGNYNGSLLYAVVFLILCYGVMHWLYKRQIFFKV